MLFCEPKNRKLIVSRPLCCRFACFSALLRAEKSEMETKALSASFDKVSVLFCEPKNRKCAGGDASRMVTRVSVLFCEPKNRKCDHDSASAKLSYWFQCSSASRKIGNSNRPGAGASAGEVSVLFCEPKNRKSKNLAFHPEFAIRFSALLRAEKSEMWSEAVPVPSSNQFQCSSASRKIGNPPRLSCSPATFRVSVLFCEPKNRKSPLRSVTLSMCAGFSALLRAEKSEIAKTLAPTAPPRRFSALLRAEKSEMICEDCFRQILEGFSALLRAEKSEIAGTLR